MPHHPISCRSPHNLPFFRTQKNKLWEDVVYVVDKLIYRSVPSPNLSQYDHNIIPGFEVKFCRKSHPIRFTDICLNSGSCNGYHIFSRFWYSYSLVSRFGHREFQKVAHIGIVVFFTFLESWTASAGFSRDKFEFVPSTKLVRYHIWFSEIKIVRILLSITILYKSFSNIY